MRIAISRRPRRRCGARTLLVLGSLALAPTALARAGAGPSGGQDSLSAPTAARSLKPEALAELAEVVRGYLRDDLIVGGELLVIERRQVVLHEAFGMRDRERELPWVKDTPCNIRSMTKPLTGAAAQILIDRGELALDDRVSQHLPGFDTDAARDITIDQLMQHRSGLPLSIMLSVEDMAHYGSLYEQANAVGTRGPEFEPDGKFWYSDAGSDALAAVVEVITGTTIDAFWEKELFGPLGMHDTFVPRDRHDPRYERIATLYVGTAHLWNPFWSCEEEPLYPYAWGSQTVYSTPRDYARFLALWMDDGMAGDRRILSPEAVQRTLTPTSPMSMLGSDARYPTDYEGLELWYGRMAMVYVPTEDPDGSTPVVIGHGGSDGTMASAWPDRDLMILYFTQSRGGTTVLRIEEQIERLLLHPDRPRTVAEVPERLRPYVGTYVANFATHRDEPFRVFVRDGKLALDVPTQMVFELVDPDEQGRWAFAIAPDQVTVTFERETEAGFELLRIHQAGLAFDVPRAGTELAQEMAEVARVDPEEVAPLLGTYFDPQAEADLTVFHDDGMLCLRAPPSLVFHLERTDTPGRWRVKELPIAEISFDADDTGAIVSLTRHIRDEVLTMPRK